MENKIEFHVKTLTKWAEKEFGDKETRKAQKKRATRIGLDSKFGVRDRDWELTHPDYRTKTYKTVHEKLSDLFAKGYPEGEYFENYVKCSRCREENIAQEMREQNGKLYCHNC